MRVLFGVLQMLQSRAAPPTSLWDIIWGLFVYLRYQNMTEV